MKKLFIAVLAVAALASCAQDEIISKNQTAIEFGDAFVNNSTKALYEGTNYVKAFQVWGTVTGQGGTVALYEGANVTNTAVTDDNKTGYGAAWTCDVTRFWTPSCAYAFYAVVDASVEAGDDGKIAPNTNVTASNGVPTSIAYTADGQNDLLYGETTDTTNAAGTPTKGTLVKFNMQHLLSRIQFSFANGVELTQGDKAAYSFKVTSLSVKTWAAGDCAVPDKIWTRDGENEYTLTFATGDAPYTTEGKVIIPGEQELLISYTYEVYFDNDTTTGDAAKKIYTATVTDKALTHNFAVNHSYNIKAELDLDNQIQFTIQNVTDWTPAAGDVTIQ